MCIAITMGDSSGVGPEIILQAFASAELPHDFIVVGDFSILQLCNEKLNYRVVLKKIQTVDERESGFGRKPQQIFQPCSGDLFHDSGCGAGGVDASVLVPCGGKQIRSE